VALDTVEEKLSIKSHPPCPATEALSLGMYIYIYLSDGDILQDDRQNLSRGEERLSHCVGRERQNIQEPGKGC
jgi:hypothetical protein